MPFTTDPKALPRIVVLRAPAFIRSKSMLPRIAGYDPSQPRDDAGRWSGGGDSMAPDRGDGSGAHGTSPSEAGESGGRAVSEFAAFKSGAAAEKALAASAEQWSDADTSDYFANKPIKEYAGTSDSFRINDCMRKACSDQRLNDTANSLDALIEKTSFPADIQASRAINPKNDDEREAILESFKAQVGKEFTDPAFVSTTANRKYADEWAKKMGKTEPIRCTVLVPKGAKAAYLPKTHVGKQEWEVLIQRGSRFKVREATDEGVVLELLT